MQSDAALELLTSANSLKIAALVSVRPRTLSELAELTGISIQGALKHIKKLERLGLARGEKISGKDLGVRKVYSASALSVGDFSSGDLKIVKVSKRVVAEMVEKDPLGRMEFLAEEALVQRRRIRDEARRLGRLIDDLVEDERRLQAALDSINLDDDSRLILHTMFTEETAADGERVLTKHFGMKGGRRSIDEALAKARYIAKK